ncbi:MAG: hypothetical protein WKF78_15640 [Candidatus Limnocylindrales bacterium]
MIALRVMPSSRSSLTGGVMATPSRTTKMLAADDLVDVAARRQHDRLVEAVELGFRLLEGHVDVSTDDLAPGRQRVVRVTPPGRGHDPHALLGVDVVPERHGDDVQLVVQVVQSNADRPGRLVEGRTDVGVFAEAVAAHGLDDQAGQLVHRRNVVHQQDPARLTDALGVLAQFQAVELALVGIPIRPDAFEGRRPVHERVGHDADLGVAHRDELALEITDQVVQRCRGRGMMGARGRRVVRVGGP